MNDIQQKNRRFFQQWGWTLAEYLKKYLMLNMVVEKSGWAIENDPGVIAKNLALI